MRTWTDEQLKVAIQQSDCWSATMRLLGLKVAAGNFRTLKKYAHILNIDTSHFVGMNWVGTRNKFPNPAKPIEEILVENSTFNTSHLKNKLVKLGLKDLVCENCELDTWQGKPIPIEVDHINGVSNDHRIENLRFLCPNCHALTPTWKGRNRKGL